MKNILVFTSTFPCFKEGDTTPPFIYELSKRVQREAKKEGGNVIILTPRVPGSKIYELQDDMKIYRYPYFFKDKREKLNDGSIIENIKYNKRLIFQVPFLLIMGFIYLIKITKKEHIDSIHAHRIFPQGFLAVLYKTLSKILFNKSITVIITSLGGDIFGLQNTFRTRLKRWTLQGAHHITALSTSIHKKIADLCPKISNKITTVPLGVDVTLFHPNAYDKNIKTQRHISGPFLLCVGRLVEKKGIGYLIDAIPGIIEQFPTTKLLIIGTGPLSGALQQQTKKLGLEDHIIFTGALANNNLPKYFATADIFIGPSIIAKNGDSEGLGVVFIEAILSGCITLGSNLYGITDIIKDKETGFLIEPKNSTDIKEKILYCINHLDTLKKKKLVIREIIKQKFDRDAVVKIYLRLLNNL